MSNYHLTPVIIVAFLIIAKFGLVALAREGKWTKGTLCNMLLSCNDCVLNTKLKDNIFQLKKKKKERKAIPRSEKRVKYIFAPKVYKFDYFLKGLGLGIFNNSDNLLQFSIFNPGKLTVCLGLVCSSLFIFGLHFTYLILFISYVK